VNSCTFKHRMRRCGTAPLPRSSSYLCFSSRFRASPGSPLLEGGGAFPTSSRDFLYFHTSSVVLETLVIIPFRRNKFTFSSLNKELLPAPLKPLTWAASCGQPGSTEAAASFSPPLFWHRGGSTRPPPSPSLWCAEPKEIF